MSDRKSKRDARNRKGIETAEARHKEKEGKNEVAK